MINFLFQSIIQKKKLVDNNFSKQKTCSEDVFAEGRKKKNK
jgi:hypothetical protein